MPTTNSKAILQQRVASTWIEVTYHRPSVRGRKIFDELVVFTGSVVGSYKLLTEGII